MTVGGMGFIPERLLMMMMMMMTSHGHRTGTRTQSVPPVVYGTNVGRQQPHTVSHNSREAEAPYDSHMSCHIKSSTWTLNRHARMHPPTPRGPRLPATLP